MDNFHKVPVIIQKENRCECDLTLWPSYLLCDYKAVTYKERHSVLTLIPLPLQNNNDPRAHDIATLETSAQER
jgi:hypothetical protein